MAGFLDPKFTTEPTDYRAVIDGLIARVQPARGYFFGSRIDNTDVSIGILGDRRQYTDGNTILEHALDSVAANPTASATYIIIGDGRRSDPNHANAQYVRMRNEAAAWIGKGGTFLVTASLAPFYPVSNDASGCRLATAEESNESRCPLYAFTFVAAGDLGPMASALAAVSQHVFAWPLPAIAPDNIVLVNQSPATAGVRFSSPWTRTSTQYPIIRLENSTTANAVVTARVQLVESTSQLSRAAWAALRAQTRGALITTRRLDTAAVKHPWTPTSAAALVRELRRGDLDFQLVSYPPGLGRTSHCQHCALYRIDIMPSGTPSWLSEFDASDRADAVRTFGFGRLFELFRSEEESARPAARFYVVTR
jgi:hypothetical protein